MRPPRRTDAAWLWLEGIAKRGGWGLEGGLSGALWTRNCEETKPEAPQTSPVLQNIMNCINHKLTTALSVYVE